jgi:lipoyl-dependent peroxiredoxin
MDSYPYTFFSRYGKKPATNPEELLGAAQRRLFCHVVCSNARNRASRAGTIGQQIGSRHRQGWRRIRHHVGASFCCCEDTGIDEARFQSIAMKAKAGCPVSKLMNTNISFEARLLS